MQVQKKVILWLIPVLMHTTCHKDDNSDTNTPLDTPAIGSLQVFPIDNPWNTDISKAEVDPNSINLIASIGINTRIHPDFGTFWEGSAIGIPFNVIGKDQPKVNVTFQYASESDKGPYPIPPDARIEAGTDKHVLVVDTFNRMLYELFNANKNNNNSWNAGSGAIFDLTINQLRPDYWTSADAAGLPIFSGLVRYEEVVEKGEINHALRFTAENTRNAFVHPATHAASENDGDNYPPLGMRVRLKADFDLSGFSPHVQVILKALKKYGMFLADNGSNWYISGTHDIRWDDEELGELKTIRGNNFEVVKMGTIIPMTD